MSTTEKRELIKASIDTIDNEETLNIIADVIEAKRNPETVIKIMRRINPRTLTISPEVKAMTIGFPCPEELNDVDARHYHYEKKYGEGLLGH